MLILHLYYNIYEEIKFFIKYRAMNGTFVQCYADKPIL
jgi:hypothetical protein